MLDREFVRKLKLYNGHEEVVTVRFGLNEKGRKVEHVTLEVPDSSRFMVELSLRRRRRKAR